MSPSQGYVSFNLWGSRKQRPSSLSLHAVCGPLDTIGWKPVKMLWKTCEIPCEKTCELFNFTCFFTCFSHLFHRVWKCWDPVKRAVFTESKPLQNPVKKPVKNLWTFSGNSKNLPKNHRPFEGICFLVDVHRNIKMGHLQPGLNVVICGVANATSFYSVATKFSHLGPVVRTPVSTNPGLNFNPGFFFFLSKALSQIIFSILFRVSNHQIVGKDN